MVALSNTGTLFVPMCCSKKTQRRRGSQRPWKTVRTSIQFAGNREASRAPFSNVCWLAGLLRKRRHPPTRRKGPAYTTFPHRSETSDRRIANDRANFSVFARRGIGPIGSTLPWNARRNSHKSKLAGVCKQTNTSVGTRPRDSGDLRV
jgi:hypothetical protein